MANIDLHTILQLRNDTEANWIAVQDTVIPKKGEACISLDKGKIKIGDGTSTWKALKYINATPEELSASGVQNVVISGDGNAIANAVFEGGILTLTKGTFLTEHQDISGKLDKNPDIAPVATESFVKVKYDAKGLITGSTAVTKADITGLGIPGQDNNTTYTLSGATNETAGADVVLTPSAGGAQKLNITGAGTTSVAYADGKITITSVDNSKEYNLKPGSANGTVAFGVTGEEADVAVTGLKSAAYTESSAYATAAQGTKADTALQTVTVAGKALTQDTSEITANEIKTAIGVQSTITGDGDTGLPTSAAVVTKIKELIASLGSVLNYKGNKTYEEIIALTDAKVGDVWITPDGHEYVCITAATEGAENWEDLGTTVDLSGYLTIESAAGTYATKTELSTGLNGKQNTITSENKLSGSLIDGAVAEATHATNADNATNATKATQDAAGNVIVDTYATKAELPTAETLGAITGISGNNGVTVNATDKTNVTVGLNLTDVFILNGGNAAGTWE